MPLSESFKTKGIAPRLLSLVPISVRVQKAEVAHRRDETALLGQQDLGPDFLLLVKSVESRVFIPLHPIPA